MSLDIWTQQRMPECRDPRSHPLQPNLSSNQASLINKIGNELELLRTDFLKGKGNFWGWVRSIWKSSFKELHQTPHLQANTHTHSYRTVVLYRFYLYHWISKWMRKTLTFASSSRKISVKCIRNPIDVDLSRMLFSTCSFSCLMSFLSHFWPCNTTKTCLVTRRTSCKFDIGGEIKIFLLSFDFSHIHTAHRYDTSNGTFNSIIAFPKTKRIYTAVRILLIINITNINITRRSATHLEKTEGKMRAGYAVWSHEFH